MVGVATQRHLGVQMGAFEASVGATLGATWTRFLTNSQTTSTCRSLRCTRTMSGSASGKREWTLRYEQELREIWKKLIEYGKSTWGVLSCSSPRMSRGLLLFLSNCYLPDFLNTHTTMIVPRRKLPVATNGVWPGGIADQNSLPREAHPRAQQPRRRRVPVLKTWMLLRCPAEFSPPP